MSITFIMLLSHHCHTNCDNHKINRTSWNM